MSDPLTQLRALLPLAEAIPQEQHWEEGGPYPHVSVITNIDSGSGWPDPTPPSYDLVASVHVADDLSSKPPEGARRLANFIAASRNFLTPETIRELIRVLESRGDV